MASVSTAQKLEGGGDSRHEELLQHRGISYRPYFQLTVLGFVCFMCTGMIAIFSSFAIILKNVDFLSVLSKANMANIITYSIVTFFSGVIVNALGPRLSLFVGGLGVTLYIVSFWAISNNYSVYRFIIAAQAIQGICAGMLSTAQGAMMLAYPTENRKGLVIGIFWSIFYLGSLIGTAIIFSADLKGRFDFVNTGLYAGFVVLTLVGALLALFIVNPIWIIRTDGTRVTIPRQSALKTAFQSLYAAVKSDPIVLLLFPMFFTSNYFFAWQQLTYNFILFDRPTSTLNILVFAITQIVTSMFLGFGILDRSHLSRRTRAFTGWAIVFVLVFVVHIWAYFYIKKLNLSDFGSQMNFTNSAYSAHVWLYIFCAFLNAAWNVLVFWLLGAISNNFLKLAVFVGFYQSLNVAGSAAAGAGLSLPFVTALISSWVLCAVSLLVALPMIYYRIKEHSDLDDEEFESKL